MNAKRLGSDVFTYLHQWMIVSSSVLKQYSVTINAIFNHKTFFILFFSLFGKRLRSVGGGQILAILQNKLHFLNSCSFSPVVKLYLTDKVLRMFLLWITNYEN